MKKKDLVPGTIYSPKYSTPYLLLSTRVNVTFRHRLPA